MAISIGSMLSGIEQDVSSFLNNPLSIFDGMRLNKADQERVTGIRNSLQPPRIAPGIVGRAVTPASAAPAAGGGPVTINIHITVYPDGVVAGVGAADAGVGQPQAVMVPPPPDMRKQAAQQIAQLQGERKPAATTTRKVVRKPVRRPGR